MPCFRCGARQTDPVRGASPWKRGVRADHQVLICPRCQAVHDWADALDRCSECGSAALVCLARRGGVPRLRPYPRRRPGRAGHGRPRPLGGPATADGGLSEEVAAALSRVLKRGPAA
ncbi:hypothetical protein ACFQY7_24410 [Actinomadura luteofluorescens]|uniref:hypothetical protein n=1 Tax=Actinomadura luteofluorescens TaxID=46163 RepID=UPI0036423C7E